MGKSLRPSLHIWAIVSLAIVTFGTFWRILGADFVNYDDPLYITHNSHIKHGITLESLKWAFATGHAANWHPLTWVSHMVDYQVWGMNPLGHHLTSLLFHIANTLLLFFVLFRMTGGMWRSAFVAALFGVHPLHVESVAWISERKDVLSTFFLLLTLWAYHSYALRPGMRRYLLVALLFALGLMAKPMLVTLPLVLLLLDFWPLRRLQTADCRLQLTTVAEKIPLFAMSLGSCIATVIAQESGKAVRSLQHYPLSVRVENALVSYVSYIIKTVWPSKLAVLYPHPKDTLPMWEVIGAFLLLTILTWMVIRLRHSHPYLIMGWLWYVVMLIPVIGLVQVGLQAMADRYMYAPLIGIGIVLAWGTPDFLSNKEAQITDRASRRRAQRAKSTSVSDYLPAIAVVIIMAWVVCTWIQTGHWRNSRSLYEHAVAVTANNYVALTNLGEVQLKDGDTEDAIDNFRAALEIEPNSAEANNDLGNALIDIGETDEAIIHLQKAVDLKPDSAKTHLNLGLALDRKGRLDEAISEFNKALEIDPDYAEAYNSLGLICDKQGDSSKAISEFETAIRLKPYLVEAYNNLGSIYLKQMKLDEAIAQYREAAKIKPDYPHTHNNLAAVLYFKGDYAGAWEEIKLCREYGGEPAPGLIRMLSQKMPEPD